jgi:hypothetical protein
MTSPGHRRQHFAVFAAFLLITLIQTWPLAARLSGTLPNDLGDPVLNTWILWWNAQAAPLTPAWWDAPMFYPTRGAMAFSETLIGLSLLASPLQWLGASPVTAYNVLFLLSFPLSAFTAYLLAWSLTRRAGPAMVAGAIYGYATFRWAHLGHLQILWSWWMPLALLGLHRWMTDRRKAGLLLFGAAWLGESLSNGYYFFYFSAIVGLWLAWFTPWRQARRTLVPALVTWAAAIALIAPMLLTYARVQQANHFQRSFEEIDQRGADAADFFRPSSVPRLPGLDRWERGEAEVWLGIVGTCALVIGVVSGFRGGLRRRGSIAQLALWGLAAATFASSIVLPIALPIAVPIALALALAGLAWSPAAEQAWRERSDSAFYLGATLVAMLLALGPTPRVLGVEVWRNGPYAWLMAIVPGFTGLRVPARFALVAVLCLAIATALLLARVRLANAARERLLFGGLVLMVLLESWPRPMTLPSLPPVLDPRVLTPASAAIELPFGGDQELAALYRAMFHRRPVVNGYSGYFPESYRALGDCLARQRADCLTPLRRAGRGLDVIVDRQQDAAGVWQRSVAEWPDAQVRFRNHQFVVVHFPAAR